MPKATVDENDSLATAKYQVRFPREVGAVQTVTIAKTVDDPAHNQLRHRVFVANTRHAFASLSGS